MKPTPPTKSKLANTIRDIILLGITVVLIYWLLAPENERLHDPVTIADLKGIWTTTHPQYRDRFLQISPSRVAFGWGEAGAGAYTIDAFENEPAKESTLVHIRYVDLAMTDYRLSFHYVNQNGGKIWMKNQKGVSWYRTSTEPTYDPPLQ